jgi:hypothetical protein
VYIEASVRINAKEFERDFYTTLYEDMVSLRAIWVSCGKPSPENRMPRAADTLERSPTELQRMVRTYLPPSWYLVAVGITTSVVDIVQDGFQGSEVIVVD